MPDLEAIADKIKEARSMVREIEPSSRDLSLVQTKLDEALLWLTSQAIGGIANA